MTDISSAQIGAVARSAEPEFRDFVALLKPRVMSLVVFTALAGMVAAPVWIHPVVALASLICIAAGAGASGALNMWWDADIDARMSRTRKRPVPSGLIAPGEALGFGLGLSLISVLMLSVFANPLAAGLLAFTIFFYAVVYTMWLKRSTPQNIVIGGAAGAFPPMIAWAAVTGEVSTTSVLMFLVIFVWTPPHFWALALFRSDDYARVGVPMMPVVKGEASTRRQIWLYTLVLVPVSIAPAFTVAGVFAIMNTTFMMTALFLTYLCVDPLIKVGTLLRCFFIDSQTTGSDILFELNNLPHEAGAEPAPSSASEATGQRREGGGNPARLAALLVLLSLGIPAATHAEPMATAAPEPASTIAEPRSGDVAALDQSIRQRLDDPVYAWRMPRERDNTVDLEADMSWIEALFGPLQDMIQSFVRRFGDAIDAFFRAIERWLKELLPSWEVDRPVVAWSAWFRLLVFALLAIVISLLAILVLRFLRRREPAKSVEGVQIVAVPDLSQEHVAADRLPPNEWLDLAAELAARGELRLALRAMFLASLSDLGQRGILALALHKSNREYRRELERRAHDRRELVAAFTQNVRTLEFVWYGNHPVTDALYREFEQNQGRIVNAATT